MKRRLNRLKPKVVKICDVCETSFITSFSNRKRCSRKCTEEFHEKVYKKFIWPYGITLEEYNQMFAEQDGCCKICKRHQSEFKGRLNIDHCHSTGRVRSLLCNQCNQALGLVRENKEVVKNMLEYLK